MTLPASFPLSMSAVATELGTTLPLSLLDARVLALAGKTGAPISMSDLLGRSGSYNGPITFTLNPGVGNYVGIVNIPFFGTELDVVTLTQDTIIVNATGLPSFTGNIVMTNTSLNLSSVLTWSGGQNFEWSGPDNGVIQGAGTWNFTICPQA